jgi:hypothetical protein
MTTKQTIKAWKNAGFTANNSPVGKTQVDTSILAQVQGGRNNIVTGCIPDPFPRFPPKGGGPYTSVIGCPTEDDLMTF